MIYKSNEDTVGVLSEVWRAEEVHESWGSVEQCQMFPGRWQGVPEMDTSYSCPKSKLGSRLALVEGVKG